MISDDSFKKILVEGVDRVEEYVGGKKIWQEYRHGPENRHDYHPPTPENLNRIKRGVRSGDVACAGELIDHLADFASKDLVGIDGLSAANAGDHFDLWPLTFRIATHSSFSPLLGERLAAELDHLGVYLQLYGVQALIVDTNPWTDGEAEIELRVRGTFKPEIERRTERWIQENSSLLSEETVCNALTFTEILSVERLEGGKLPGDAPAVKLEDVENGVPRPEFS